MTASSPHLTEDERQTMADGSLEPDRAAELDEHLRRCPSCTDDVARLRTLAARVDAWKRGGATDSAGADSLWPAIRARIDDRKVAALGSAPAPQPRRLSGAGWLLAAIAAALLAIVVPLTRRTTTGRDSLAARDAANNFALVAVADSVTAYQDEVQTLLNELEMRRAMLRPDAVAAIDHDLGVVDSAIVELKAAVVRNPNDAALRELLASSYRQKIEVLKRMGNAG